jgi:hypothetical protein
MSTSSRSSRKIKRRNEEQEEEEAHQLRQALLEVQVRSSNVEELNENQKEELKRRKISVYEIICDLVQAVLVQGPPKDARAVDFVQNEITCSFPCDFSSFCNVFEKLEKWGLCIFEKYPNQQRILAKAVFYQHERLCRAFGIDERVVKRYLILSILNLIINNSYYFVLLL